MNWIKVIYFNLLLDWLYFDLEVAKATGRDPRNIAATQLRIDQTEFAIWKLNWDL